MAKNYLATFGIIIASLAFIVFMLMRFSVDTSLNNWHKGFNGFVQASNVQQDNQKPMLVFFYTDWCENCEALRVNVLSSSDLGQCLENVIPVKINPEKGRLEAQIAKEFGIQGYPTLYLVSPTQKVLGLQELANISPEKFVQQCQTGLQSLS